MMDTSRFPRTSESHPIRVDWLPTPWPGRVGLTLAPGKHQEHPASGPPWQRDLTLDLHRLASEYRTRVLVSLLEGHEYERLKIPDLLARAAEFGWEVFHLPIRDGDVPADPSEVTTLVSAIIAAATSGRNVVIHCMGGLGRAGTIGGCVLVAGGRSSEEALKILQQVRPGAPETAGQEQFIRSFASRYENAAQ